MPAISIHTSRAAVRLRFEMADACITWQQKQIETEGRRKERKKERLMDKFHFWFGHEEAFGSNRTAEQRQRERETETTRRRRRCQQTNLQTFTDAGTKTAEEMRSHAVGQCSYAPHAPSIRGSIQLNLNRLFKRVFIVVC